MTKILSYRKGGRDMKIGKKIIVLLCIMLGMLFFNTLRVEALTFEYGNNDNLKVNDTIQIGFNDYTNKSNNLYCVEKGDFIEAERKKYEVVGRVQIKLDKIVINYKGKDKVTLMDRGTNGREYNRKLAMAIVTLDNEDLKYFLWGYFGTWIDKLNRDNNDKLIPENFAKRISDLKNKSDQETVRKEYEKLCEELKDKIDEGTYQIDDKLSVDTSLARFKNKMMDGMEYTRIGPFKMKGKPSRSENKGN